MAPLFHMCFLFLVGFLLRVYDNVPFRSAVCVPLCYKTIVCNRKQNLLTLTTNNALNYLSNDLQNHHIIYIYCKYCKLSYSIFLSYFIYYFWFLNSTPMLLIIFIKWYSCFLFCLSLVFFFAFTIIDNHSSQLKTRQNFEFVFVVFVF